MRIPVVALRGLCVLPKMLLHFDINRKKSIAAVESAMLRGQRLLVLTQKDARTEDPGEEDLFRIGTIIRIRQLIKLPGDVMRVMAEGLERAELLQLLRDKPFPEAEAQTAGYLKDLETEAQEEALLREIRDKLALYTRSVKLPAGENEKPLQAIEGLEELLDRTALILPVSYQKKQLLLEADSTTSRYALISRLLDVELEVAEIRQGIHEKVKQQIDKNQRDYILREQLKVIREELGDTDPVSDADRFAEQLRELRAPAEIKEKLAKEIKRLRTIPAGSQEATVARTYIETLLELPWQKYTRSHRDLRRAETILNEDHYGLEKIKQRIVEHLAVRILTGERGGSILCLVGPPGTGKTSIARSVARALGKKYVRISLGGVRDEAEIRGHRRTYIGAMPGRIVAGLRQAGVSDPLMLLDEIDKVSSDHRGDTGSALLEVLDGEQNSAFRDHYVELPVDLSHVMFIATANTAATIPGPLLDRMELIEVSSYTENEKYHIAADYLLEKQVVKAGLAPGSLRMEEACIRSIIRGYTREAGVRSLERRLGDICRKHACELLTGGEAEKTITQNMLGSYLGKEKYRTEPARVKPEVGIVQGLAWTSNGGTTLEIEAGVMAGSGKLALTGQMGDVMKESAQAALTYVRSVSGSYEVEPEYFEQHDLHIHIPEGAVPKDGPSAGITMALAMLSAVTDLPVRADVAMTGEITLRGRVLPIGGLKEKLLAAKVAGITTVLVPEKNRPDVEELSEEITGGLAIEYVSHMERVAALCLVRKG